MNNQGGDLYYLDYSFASGIEDEKEKSSLIISCLNLIGYLIL
jgi:hypothetical protein